MDPDRSAEEKERVIEKELQEGREGGPPSASAQRSAELRPRWPRARPAPPAAPASAAPVRRTHWATFKTLKKQETPEDIKSGVGVEQRIFKSFSKRGKEEV